MTSNSERLDKAFIERQRQRLMKLREALAVGTRSEEAEEMEINSQSNGQAEEYEDDAQRLAMLGARRQSRCSQRAAAGTDSKGT
jgi:hypothetical protein